MINNTIVTVSAVPFIALHQPHEEIGINRVHACVE